MNTKAKLKRAVMRDLEKLAKKRALDEREECTDGFYERDLCHLGVELLEIEKRRNES